MFAYLVLCDRLTILNIIFRDNNISTITLQYIARSYAFYACNNICQLHRSEEWVDNTSRSNRVALDVYEYPISEIHVILKRLPMLFVNKEI